MVHDVIPIIHHFFSYLQNPEDMWKLVRGVRALLKIAHAEPLAAHLDHTSTREDLDHQLHLKSDVEIAELVKDRVQTVYHPIIAIVYVDDVCFMGTKGSLLLNELKQKFMARWECRDLGETCTTVKHLGDYSIPICCHPCLKIKFPLIPISARSLYLISLLLLFLASQSFLLLPLRGDFAMV